MSGLPHEAWVRFFWWLGLGLLIYVAYGARHARLGRSGA
jgi:APA family basic amino acid/polyamine antiporter